jgi:5S rRNA maturation endonuclease (ribonuclease M5)
LAPSEMRAQQKELRKLMEKLEDSLVLVEGKKDERALSPYMREGRILQISSGRLRNACAKAAQTGAREAVILTDRDRAGEELAALARDELRANGISPNMEVRHRLLAILMLTYVENFGSKYEEKMKELSEN